MPADHLLYAQVVKVRENGRLTEVKTKVNFGKPEAIGDAMQVSIDFGTLKVIIFCKSALKVFQFISTHDATSGKGGLDITTDAFGIYPIILRTCIFKSSKLKIPIRLTDILP